ncbi:MAG: hypothetical protein Q8W48_09225, partial [Candidatus Palauibacterales bacterium]|nr:hypothetical protein [Candidatus Palauibacterales bacterium]
GRSGARAILISLIVGLVLGITAGLWAPKLLGDRLPQAVRRSDSLVTGIVLAKQRETDRLLLTVETPEGAILATFKEKIEEIALLVDVDDTMTFELRRYSPFIDDPTIAGVRKSGAAPAAPAALAAPAAPQTSDSAVQADSLAPAPAPARRADAMREATPAAAEQDSTELD